MANPLDCNGKPLPWSTERCGPGPVIVDVCYTVPPSLVVLEGTKAMTLNPDCTVASTVIRDSNDVPVPGAVEVTCPSAEGCCDPGSLCSILQALPTQVPGVGDTAVFVTPAGCFLGVPGGGGGGFPGYGAPVATACANAPGVSALAARADHVHRSEIPVAEDGAAVGSRCTLNFTGTGVSVADNAGLDRVDVTIDAFNGGTITNPILAASGSCAAPAYSFTASPDSGMFYTGTAVRVSDDNCDDYIEVGASINIVSTSGTVTTSAGTSILNITPGSFLAIAGTTAGLSGSGTVTVVSGAANIDIDAATNVEIGTAGLSRLLVHSTGAWGVSAGGFGLAGQVITSFGPGVPVAWATITPAGIGANPTLDVRDAGVSEVVGPTVLDFDDGFVVTPAGTTATIDLDYGTPVATGTANAAGASTQTVRADHVHRTLVGVEDGGVAIGSRPTINFIEGANVTITVVDNGGSDRVDVTISATSSGPSFIQRFTFQADQFDSPVNANWAVNALAPAAADTVNAAIVVRRFDDTTEEGVGGLLTVPPGAVNATFYFKWRAQTAPGAAAGVVLTYYTRSIPDNAAVGAWSAAVNFTTLSVPTNTNFQYDSQTISLATLGWTAGTLRQFEITRRGAQAGDTLTGDFCLAEMIVEFT
jgi:hypothetical protein